MNRFERVVQILDQAIGGPDATIRAHGPFWRRKTRDEFVAAQVFGVELVAVGRGEASNLVRALKGEVPFDGSQFARMPSGRPPVPGDEIAFIERWIDDGCPEDELPSGRRLSWRPTNAPRADPDAGKRYDDVFFLTPELGWGVNSDGKILRTSDAGTTWEQQFHDARTYLRCIGFASGTRGWAGTLSGPARLLQTTDGGARWGAVAGLPAEAPRMVCGLAVVDEAVVYGCGTNYPFPFAANPAPALVKTVDGGATWTGIDMRPFACLLVDTMFTSRQRGWVVGGRKPDPSVPAGDDGRANVKPVVLLTEDGGQTWVDRLAGIQDQLAFGEWGWKIQFVDDRTGFVSLESFAQGAILKTTDGGQSWERLVVNDPQHNANLEGIGFVDGRHGWVGGWGTPDFTGGHSSETDDGGRTWRDANHIGTFINRFRFFGRPAQSGYAAGATVFKYSAEPVPTPEAARAPVAATLRAVDADAGRPLRVAVRVPEGTSRLEVNVWERFGRHVRTVADEAGPASGERTIEWDGTGDEGRPLAAGSYILRATVDDDSDSRIVRLGA